MRNVTRTMYERLFEGIGADAWFVELRRQTNGREYDSLPEFMDVVRRFQPGMESKMSEFLVDHGTEEYHAMFNTIMEMYTFWFHGKRLFNISDGLVKALIGTDVDKCSTDFLALPFRSICLSFSDSFFTIAYHGKDRRVSEIYMIEDVVGDKKTWRVLVVGNPDDLGGDVGSPSFFFRVSVNAGERIGDGFELVGKVAYEKSHYEEQLDTFWKFISSIILYVNSTEFRAGMSHNQIPRRPIRPKKARRHDRQYGGLSKMGFYNIGKDIRIDGHRPSDIPNETNLHQQYKHSYRYMVRGHMHAFWYGKMDGERIKKIQWIRPFWKGPELARVVQKSYQVK